MLSNCQKVNLFRYLPFIQKFWLKINNFFGWDPRKIFLLLLRWLVEWSRLSFSMSSGDDEKQGSVVSLPRCYTTSVVLGAVRAVPPIRADMKTTGSQLHSVMNETVSSSLSLLFVSLCVLYAVIPPRKDPDSRSFRISRNRIFKRHFFFSLWWLDALAIIILSLDEILF